MGHTVRSPDRWKASVTRATDVNGREFLCLVAEGTWGTCLTGRQARPLKLDAWFVRTDPPASYVPFCGSDE